MNIPYERKKSIVLASSRIEFEVVEDTDVRSTEVAPVLSGKRPTMEGLLDTLPKVNLANMEVAYKNKKAVIPFQERLEIVRSIKYVDAIVAQESMDKFKVWEKLKFDVLFVGDDWYNTEKWKDLEEKLKALGVKIIYFPYTKGTSSTLINSVLNDLRDDNKKA